MKVGTEIQQPLLGGDLAGRAGDVELQGLGGGDGGGEDLDRLDGNLGDLHAGVHAALLLVLGPVDGLLVSPVLALWFRALGVRLVLTVLPGPPQQRRERLLPRLVLHVQRRRLETGFAAVLVVLLRVGEGLLLDPLGLTEGGVLGLQSLHQVLDARVCGREAGQAEQAKGFTRWRE